MKNLKTVFVILISIINYSISAQVESNQETIAEFEIFVARKNDQDITPQIMAENAYLVIYKENDTLMFSNFWTKEDSQSYGEIYSIEKEMYPETEEDYKAILYRFSWSYINTYDDKIGSAKFKLVLIYKPQGTYFQLTMQPENLDITVFKGKVTGDLDTLENKI